MAWHRILALTVLITGSVGGQVLYWAQSSPLIEVGKFSSDQPGAGLPNGWKPLTFKKIPKQTEYVLVRDGEQVVVKATSDASASGLTREVAINPKDYPIVRWRWKVENLLQHSDVSRKDGDDYPARLYITFAYDPDKVSLGRKLKYNADRAIFGDIPIVALNYIWETRVPIGTIVEHAYTDFGCHGFLSLLYLNPLICSLGRVSKKQGAGRAQPALHPVCSDSTCMGMWVVKPPT